MYFAIQVVLFLASAVVLIRGFRKNSTGLVVAGASLIAFSFLFFQMLEFLGELYWYQALGYSNRFWTLWGSRLVFALISAVLIGVVSFALLLPLPTNKKIIQTICSMLSAIVGAIWGFSSWDDLLLFWNGDFIGKTDPILGKDIGFYLFHLPFWDSAFVAFVAGAFITIIGAVFSLVAIRDGLLMGGRRPLFDDQSPGGFRAVFVSLGYFILLLGIGKWLDTYHLLFSDWGAVRGAGWTDVHIRLPALYVTSILFCLAGLLLIILPFIRKYPAFLNWLKMKLIMSPVKLLMGYCGILTAWWILILGLLPMAWQWARVEPNEISFEMPYIEHNIAFTQSAFGLDKIQEKEFPANDTLSRQMVQRNQDVFENVRLWDWRALDAVFKQFQEIRLYYEFIDVDIDRYRYGDQYSEVMISARELEIENLPAQSQTFVNRRFKYTHGFGLTMTPVSKFTEEGLPQLLIRDIPPKSLHPELEVEQPRIYYGELTETPVVVNSSEKEFDFPQGDENAYYRYNGKGGVQLSNLWKKFLYGYVFDGTRFFLSGYPTKESRILYRRQIRERIEELAPFLRFDSDPYIVLAEGRLHWIIDAYTTSRFYPYSEPYALQNIPKSVRERSGTGFLNAAGTIPEHINYIRNSVKVVVDAYHGSVDFFVFDPEDPLINAWDKSFPGMFQPADSMPRSIMEHIRYPQGMLLMQGEVYAKYHMTDPEVFYNQEDLWVRATEKYYGQVVPVDPYYIMWKPPGEKEPQFVLILPFTPKKRQVLIGWIAAICDPKDYGKFLAYKFPKEKRVLGPQQVETKIDQDRFLSGQLSLWDQRGSRVIRGNVLAIPIENTLVYVEPIYLQAETAAYPELRLVAMMHGDNLSYAQTFEKALEGLLEEGDSPIVLSPDIPLEGKQEQPKGKEMLSGEEMIQNAATAFENYQQAMGQGRFQEAGAYLEKLGRILEKSGRFDETNNSLLPVPDDQ